MAKKKTKSTKEPTIKSESPYALPSTRHKVLVGFVAAILLIPTLWSGKALLDETKLTNVAEGRIIQSDRQPSASKFSSEAYQITYAFTVNGNEYTGKQRIDLTKENTRGNLTYAHTTINVHYDPNNPAEHKAGESLSKLPTILLFSMLVYAAVFALLYAFTKPIIFYAFALTLIPVLFFAILFLISHAVWRATN